MLNGFSTRLIRIAENHEEVIFPVASWKHSGTNRTFRSLMQGAAPTAVIMIALLSKNEKTGLTAQSLPVWSPSKLAKDRLAERRSTYLCRMETSAFVSIIWAFIILFIVIQPGPHDGPYWDLISVRHAVPAPDGDFAAQTVPAAAVPVTA